MRRFLIAAAGLCALAATTVAQPDAVPKDGKVVYPMLLSPATPRKPVSRDYLLPEYRDAIVGNKVQMFLRCFMEQDRFFGKEESDKRETYHKMTLAELPAELNTYGGRLVERDMYDAARMTQSDWQLIYFIQRDGYNTLLPDVQKFRALVNVLKVRVRGEIAAKNYDGAIHTLKTMFGLATTMQQHPTLIGSLVGVAIATITVNAIDEFVAQPGAPNLFWALSDLPAPFFDLRLAAQGERMFISYQFASLINAPGALTDREVWKAIAEIEEMVGIENNSFLRENKKNEKVREKYERWAADSKRVAVGRARLIEYGHKADAVKDMTPLQVTVTDDLLRYEVQRDELFKWVRLPMYEGAIDADEAAMKKERNDMILAPALIAAILKIKQAQARLDQRIGYLRIIEGLRIHAAQHDGKLPETLADVKLPLPIDPFTGKPFEYSVKDGVATLHGMNPLPGSELMNRYYEIRIRK